MRTKEQLRLPSNPPPNVLYRTFSLKINSDKLTVIKSFDFRHEVRFIIKPISRSLCRNITCQ